MTRIPYYARCDTCTEVVYRTVRIQPKYLEVGVWQHLGFEADHDVTGVTHPPEAD